MQKLGDLQSLLHDDIIDTRTIYLDKKTIIPDGGTLVPCRNLPNRVKAASFFELKNGVGEGDSDPINQGECGSILQKQ